MAIDYAEIVEAELAANDITLCADCDRYQSHKRGFAAPDSRIIHYDAKMATRGTLYGFLHEVGHVIKGHGKSCKLRRWQKEQEAEAYARESMRAYGIPVPLKNVQAGDAYVRRFRLFGERVAAGRRN